MHTHTLSLLIMANIVTIVACVMADQDRPLVLRGGSRTLKAVDGRQVVISGTSLLKLTDQEALLNDAEIRLNSEDA